MNQVYLNSKKAHKDAVISTASFTGPDNRKLPHLLFSASQDGFIKLWDLRVDKAVKLFKHPSLKADNYSNLQVDSARNHVYLACDEKLLAFDVNTDKLVIDEARIQSISHDAVNFLDLNGDRMTYVDDK